MILNRFENITELTWHCDSWKILDEKKEQVLPSSNSDKKSGFWNQNKLMNAFPPRKKNCCSTVLNWAMNKKEEHKTKRPLRIKSNTVLSESWTQTFCFFFFCCLRELNALSGSRTFPIHCFNTAQTLNSFLESIDTGRVVLSKKKYIVKISSCYDKMPHEASQANFDWTSAV